MTTYLYCVRPINTEDLGLIRSALEAYECRSTQVFRDEEKNQTFVRLSLKDSDKLISHGDIIVLPKEFGSASIEEPLCIFQASLKLEESIGALDGWAHMFFSNEKNIEEKLSPKYRAAYEEISWRIRKMQELQTMIDLECARLQSLRKQVMDGLKFYGECAELAIQEGLKAEGTAKVDVSAD